MASSEQGTRVLAIFCNPKGTDALRLQAEQRVLQQALRSASAVLEVVPAATLDDLRAALMGKRFDVIHFSGHGCVDGPLQALVRHKTGGAVGSPQMQYMATAVAALKHWLRSSGSLSPPSDTCTGTAGSSTEAERTVCTLVIRPASPDGCATAWVEGNDRGSDCTPHGDGSTHLSDTEHRSDAVGAGSVGGEAESRDLRVPLRASDFIRHRVGALAFEGPTGALEPPKPDVLARLLLAGLEPRQGVVFLNACETHIQARRSPACNSGHAATLDPSEAHSHGHARCMSTGALAA